MVMLWTWQGFDFNPLLERVDRSRSYYVISPPHSDLLLAYAELDELLSLPAEKKHQYAWCYTTDSWLQHPWYERCVWPLEIPKDKIVAYIDEPSWERLIGNLSVPPDLRESWRRELWSQQFVGERLQQELAKRDREYLRACPPRAECLRALLNPTEPGRGVLALAPVPFDPSWIRPYDLSRRYPNLTQTARKPFRFSRPQPHGKGTLGKATQGGTGDIVDY
jgi:hypothetical protein